MKKIIFAFAFILSAISSFSQDFEPSFTVGLNTGTDHNFNAYQVQNYTLRSGYEHSYYGIENQFNVGLDFAVSVSKKLRTRLELRYVNNSYGITWTGNSVPFVSTTWNVNNFDFNLHLDYLLLSYKKLDLYASPGLKYEFYTGEYILTLKKDGTHITDLLDFMDNAYPKAILGGSLSMLFKYNLSKHIGITFIPDYTMFFRKYVRSNNNGYERLSLNVGLEFKF